MIQLDGPVVCRDFQDIKVQEHLKRLNVGSIPRSMMVILQDDLVIFALRTCTLCFKLFSLHFVAHAQVHAAHAHHRSA